MNILITGATGFLGKNLIDRLSQDSDINIMRYTRDTDLAQLDEYLNSCDFVFHFAAVHRPKDPMEFYKVNDDFFEWILDKLEEHDNTCPVVFTSSIQALDKNDYGRSKLIAENLLRAHAERSGSKAIIYRLTNTFGRWATPNLHSVAATFCYNINRDIPITISNRKVVMNFYYIDEVIDSFILQLSGDVQPCEDGIYRLPADKVYPITLGELADTLMYFRECQKKNITPELDTALKEKLWRTYISYAE